MPRPNPFLLIAMLFWGYNFVSLKVLYGVMQPGAVLFWRYFVMWGVLCLICWGQGISLKIPKEHRWRVLLAGFNSMGIYMILFMEGVKRAPAGESAIILATNPLMVAVGAMLLGYEKFSWTKIVGGIIALFGVGLVVFGRPHAQSGTSSFLGDVLLFLSAISWAWSVIIAKPITQHIKPLPLFTMSMLGGLPLVVLYGWNPAMAVNLSNFQWVHWLNFAQIAFGSGVIAMVFYYRGVSMLPASTATLHQMLVPLLTTVFAAIILGERLVPIQGVGAAILLLGLSIAMGLIKKRGRSLDRPL